MGAGDADAFGIGIDQKHRQALRVACRTACARHDNQLVGNVTVNDEFLFARQFEAIARFFGRHGNIGRIVVVGFFQSQSGQQFATGNFRQKVIFLRF